MPDTNADAATRAADLALITTACEEAYADASREGYADNAAIIAAVAALKKAHGTLVAADADLNTASASVGFLNFINFFRATGAVWRADCALREARTAYINLRTAITKHGEENLRQMGCDSGFISDLKALAQLSRVQ
jgi:hypothetical protein